MKRTTLIAFLFAAIAQLFIHAQTPANDPTWVLDNTLSDEFNGTAVDNQKWHVFDCQTDLTYEYWGGGTGFSAANTTESGGYLHLRAENTPNTCYFNSSETCGNSPQHYTSNQYKTGGIKSQANGYGYGYIELFAQLPGYVDSSGVAHGNKFWPAFWLAYSLENAGCRIYHDEIDIMDECCDTYYDARTTGSGANKWDGQCSFYPVCKTVRTSPFPLCNGYHKYAVEWNVNRIIFYFDDKPYLESYAPFTAVPMQLIVDLQINSDYGLDFSPVSSASTDYCHTIDFDPEAFSSGHNPAMTLDYLRYYHLKLDCGASLSLQSDADITNYFNITTPTLPGPPAVKSDIKIGNSSSVISLGSADARYFRAVNGISIEGEFTVPLGAEMGLIPGNCN